MAPHLAAREAHQRLWEFSITTPKRLLQQYPGKSGSHRPMVKAVLLTRTRISLLRMDSKTDNERHQSKIRQQKPGGRVAQLGPSGPGGEFVRAELAAL